VRLAGSAAGQARLVLLRSKGLSKGLYQAIEGAAPFIAPLQIPQTDNPEARNQKQYNPHYSPKLGEREPKNQVWLDYDYSGS
jgi:hypothetical protein